MKKKAFSFESGLNYVRMLMKAGMIMPKVYAASYGEGNEKGIYVVDVDPNSLKMHLVQHLQTEDYPSYLVRKGQLLYASLKNATHKNTNGGVASYQIGLDGKLSYNDNYASSGRSYTHLCVSDDDRYLFAANYHVGTTAAYELENRKVIRKVSVVHHQGSGPDPQHRQTMPHVHCVGFTPDKKYLYSVDLGSDKIVLYHYDHAQLEEFRKQDIVPGSGPRHMIFSQDGRFAYLVNEIANTIMVFRYYDGTFSMTQMISTLPRHFTGESSAAAIHLSESGTHLFVSNRGHDSIAMYAVNKENGKLYLLYMVHTGKGPRDFRIYHDDVMIVACQGDNCLEILRMDPMENLLERTGQKIAVPAPVCVVF